MAVVMDYYDGETHIRIHDDECVSKEEGDRIMRQVAKEIQYAVWLSEQRRDKAEAERKKMEEIAQ